MVADLVIKLLKLDPLIKRNVLKTLSWRVIGSIDTVILGWIVTGNLQFGLKIGGTELLTKMALYYVHERLWQNIKFGLPSKQQKNQVNRLENKNKLVVHAGKITRHDRETRNQNSSFTFWFTGLSGSGKSTLAIELELWLFQQGLPVYILDGDNIRLGINSDLSFSDEDRTENVRRVAEMCKLFNDAGIVVIASFISPYNKDRQFAKSLISRQDFIEVFTDSSIETCTKRDTKGLYKLALNGNLKNFTGINSPYEPPLEPNLHLLTGENSVEECIREIKDYLISNKKVSFSGMVVS